MQQVRRSAVASLAVLVAVVALAAGPAGAVSTTLAQRQAILTKELASTAVFNDMYAHRTVPPNNDFDWSTDLCSWSPDKPLGFDFTNPCRRHDFNYRNFKTNGIFNATTKAQIDSAFLGDMRAVCAPKSVFTRYTCYGVAETYYEAVKKLGT